MRKFEEIIQGFMAFLALLLLISSVYAVVEWGTSYIFPSDAPRDNFVGLITMSVCGVFFAIWYRKMFQKEFEVFSLKVHKNSSIAILLLLGLGGQFFVSSILYFIEPILGKLLSSHGNTIDSLIQGHPVIVLMYSVLVAPIAEEIIFRGVIFNKLLLAADFFSANLIQAVLFGLYHGNVVQGVYAFAMGYLLGYVAYKYKSLFAAILVHIGINISPFIIMSLPLKMGLEYYMATGLIGVFLIFCIIHWIKKKI